MTEMTLEARRERVRKYFGPMPKNPIGAHIKLGIAVALFILSVVGNAGFVAFAAFLVLVWAAVGYVRYLRARMRALPRATDQQMDYWLNSRIPEIVEDGKRRLNIHPTEIGAGEGSGWLPFVGIPDREDWQYAQAYGQDNILRFSAYEIMVVYLSNWRLPVYQCVLDMESGATVMDQTKEYNLKQVDGMETVSDRVAITERNGPGQPGNTAQAATTAHVTRRQLVNLVVSGRPAVSLVIGISQGDSLHLEGTSRSHIDTGIATLREYLRSHQNGTPQHEDLGLSGDGLRGLPGRPPGMELPPALD